MAHWLDHSIEPSRRPKTYKDYEVHVRLHLIPWLGRHQLTRLTPHHVQDMINKKIKEGLAPKTIQNLLGTLRSTLNYAMKREWVGRNVATLVDLPEADAPEIDPLELDEARRFLEALRGHRLEALFVVTLMTGLRSAEARGLRWADVDVDGATLRVRSTVDRVDGEWRFGPPKSARSRRTLALPRTAVAVLRAHRVRQNEERLIAGGRWQDWKLVFPSTVGTPFDGANVLKQLHKVLDEAGLPRQRFHDLRHCCATLLLAEGAHLRTVMEQLGHQNANLMANLYGHVQQRTMRDAADRMEAALGHTG